MKKLFLIDGHSLIFRMYYAFLRRPMVNSKGEDTSILYGFTKFLLELIRRESPTHLAVMFDPPAKTFRHQLSPDYKANRSETPELVRAALDPLVEIVTAMGIPVLMKPGFEADDVLGTVAKRAAAKGYQAYIVSPDKDLGQVISDNIFQYKPGKGGSDAEIWDSARVCEHFGISDPLQVIDILTIWGDASDNIRGVDGVGEVGARKLVGKYGSIDGIYAHIGELTPKMAASFEAARGHIALSRDLATIRCDVDIDLDEESLALTASYNPSVAALFRKYEFPSLKNLLPEAVEDASGEAAPQKRISFRECSPDEVLTGARSAGLVALSFDRVGKRVTLFAGGCLATLPSDDGRLASILSDATLEKCAHDSKPLVMELLSRGVRVGGTLWDEELMHYLLNPERSHKLEILAESMLGIDLDISDTATQSPAGPAPAMDLFSQPAGDIPAAGGDERMHREAAVIWELFPALRQEMEKQSLTKLYLEVEMPLIEVLADMELTGVKVLPQRLREYSAKLSAELSHIEDQARGLVGEPDLNLASPRQVGNVIFDKLKLDPKARRSSRGDYPTDEETLSALKDRHPFVGLLLEYRALRKLVSTYLDPLPSLVNPLTGRIHTTFNQALTATGRLSSVRPNLQNIPVRSSRGREIRKAFVSGFEGGCILSADYSQVELRLMACLSEDPALVEGFLHGADIHADTASRIFKVPIGEVTPDQRRQAKVANFGIIYGISPFGLAQRMEIPRTEAKAFIEQYYLHYPKVREYMDAAVAKARENGFASTLFGRKRYLPDISSRNAAVRQLAERNAINAPIQGSAADIMKLAMIEVYRSLARESLRSRMVLQVHDEIIVDVYPGELERVSAIVKSRMEGVCSLAVPLTVECNYGENWLEAH